MPTHEELATTHAMESMEAYHKEIPGDESATATLDEMKSARREVTHSPLSEESLLLATRRHCPAES
jgi:hypothetical protein